jgi:hypothetical protein
MLVTTPLLESDSAGAHSLPHSLVRVRVTLRMAVYSKYFRLGSNTLESHDQSPYVTFSLTRG